MNNVLIKQSEISFNALYTSAAELMRPPKHATCLGLVHNI